MGLMVMMVVIVIEKGILDVCVMATNLMFLSVMNCGEHILSAFQALEGKKQVAPLIELVGFITNVKSVIDFTCSGTW